MSGTVIVYAVIVGVAILSSILKKSKKKAGTNNAPKKNVSYHQTTQTQYKKPPTTQPKSLEDILQSLLNDQKPPKTAPPKVEEKLVLTDKDPNKYTTLEDIDALKNVGKEEVQFYSYDNELNYKDELVGYEKTTDHHVHGAGFDQKIGEEMAEVESEWADIDWRKAIITAEILKRPEY